MNDDYAIPVFCAGVLLILLGFITWQFYAIGILALYIGFDVIGWKWLIHWAYNLFQLEPPKEVKFRYRIIQHGLMIPLLYFAGQVHIYAALVPLLIWITGGADIVYHWVAKAEVPTKFNYMFWAGPVGWYYWVVNYIDYKRPPEVSWFQGLKNVPVTTWMPYWELEFQAQTGCALAILLLVPLHLIF